MLAGVGCFFNPVKYKRPVENRHRFKKELRDDLPLYSIELSFDAEFQTDSTWRMRGNVQDHLMWQKERLLNVAIERVPAQYDKIAWLDSDILFLNDRWVEETEEVLDGKPVAQLFDKAVMLDEKFAPTKRSWGVGSALANRLDAKRAHPGYARAANFKRFLGHEGSLAPRRQSGSKTGVADFSGTVRIRNWQAQAVASCHTTEVPTTVFVAPRVTGTTVSG